MKNKLKILLLILILIPIYVKADMGAPDIKPFEMVVTNPGGIDCSTYDNKATYHMAKDETFTVRYMYMPSDTENTTYQITYKKNECQLTSLSGAVLVKDELDPKTEIDNSKENENTYSYVTELTKKEKALVYDDNGIDVKKGPANNYETVGHLDKGKTFQYKYYVSGGGGITHIYIEESNIKGWVEILESKVLIENKNKYITMKDMKLSCATVPKNKIIVPKYNTDAWSHQSLVEYQGCQKLAENRSGEKEIAAIWPRKYKTKSELTIYEYYGNTGNELAKMPTDAEIISYAQNGIQGEETTNLYVEYNQIKGWIKTGYNDIEYIEDLNIDDLKLEVEETKEDDLIDTTEKQATTTGKITDYVVTCVIIGLSIAVIALIILLIINKRKYKALKNDETKQLQK